jgi:hypothetical protein
MKGPFVLILVKLRVVPMSTDRTRVYVLQTSYDGHIVIYSVGQKSLDETRDSVLVETY